MRGRIATLFTSHFILALVTLGFCSALLFVHTTATVKEQLRDRLRATAALLAQEFPPNDLDAIHGPESVTEEPHQRLLRKARELKHADADLHFVYICRLEKGRALFVIDSDETEGQTKPGDMYEEAQPAAF